MKPICAAFRAFLPPVFLGALLWFILHFCKISGLMIERLEFLLNAIITCSATFSGFILTSVSILIGASSSAIMQKITRGSAFIELRCNYIMALVIGLIVIIYFSYLGAVADTSGLLTALQTSVSAAILVSYLTSVLLTSFYLLSIIGNIPKDFGPPVNTASTPKGDFRV